jgi:hypothetical protein
VFGVKPIVHLVPGETPFDVMDTLRVIVMVSNEPLISLALERAAKLGEFDQTAQMDAVSRGHNGDRQK